MVCIECKQDKSIESFEWQKDRPNPRKVCKLCRSRKRTRVITNAQRERHNARKRQYWHDGRGKRASEKSKYNMTKDEFNYYECCICGETHRLCIDHDHDTLQVRGLLCGKCNSGLGMFTDNINKLKNAINYLEHFNKGGDTFLNLPELNKTQASK